MEIQITSRHAKASPTLQDSITDRMNKLQRYYDKISTCHVILDTEHTDKIVEIIIKVQHRTLSATGKSDLLGKAIDDAMDKIERQLKKINQKIKDHKKVKTGKREFKSFPAEQA